MTELDWTRPEIPPQLLDSLRAHLEPAGFVPDPEELALLLEGCAESDELAASDLIAHLLQSSPVCLEACIELAWVIDQVDHHDLDAALHEWRRAPALYARLAELPEAERLRRLQDPAEEGLASWGLCQLLLAGYRERAAGDPAAAYPFARLAAALAARLPLLDDFHEHWVGDLQALAWACLGDARMRLRELRGAADAFHHAQLLLAASGSGRKAVAAQVIELAAGLEVAAGRPHHAVAQLDRAAELYAAAGDEVPGAGRDPDAAFARLARALAALRFLRRRDTRLRIDRVLVRKASALTAGGQARAAQELLIELTGRLDPAIDPALALAAGHQLVLGLIRAGEEEEAARRFALIAPLYELHGGAAGRWHRLWVEARVTDRHTSPEAVEAAFQEARRGFTEAGLGYEAAIVALHLASFHAGRLDTAAMLALADDLLPVLRRTQDDRDVVAALYLLREAVARGLAPEELIARLLDLLAPARRPWAPFPSLWP